MEKRRKGKNIQLKSQTCCADRGEKKNTSTAKHVKMQNNFQFVKKGDNM